MADILKTTADPQYPGKFQVIFPDFADGELKTLFSYFELRHYAAGETVWQEGDPMEFMGFLLDGKFVVKREGRFVGKYIILAVLEKGALFGEMSVAALQRHSVTLAAVEKTETCILPHNKAQELFRKEPLLSIKLLKKIVVVAGLRLQHTGARLAELL
jgi:CRP/FNR family transcriptional regulator, cyclic AMP receptor protein